MHPVLRYMMVVLLMLAAGAARALPCASASLADYLALGPGGCTVGGLTFSSFSLPDVLSPSATPIDPSVIAVAPVASAAGTGLQLAFAPAQAASAGQFLDLRLGFDVLGSGITGAHAALLGPVAIGDAAVTLVEDLCLGASFADPVNLLCPATTQTLIAIAIDGFADNPVNAAFGAQGLAGVVAEIGIDAGLAGSAALTGAELRFLSAAAAVPVPSSLWLLAIAALAASGAGGLRRKPAAA